jgi:hypothetical protein
VERSESKRSESKRSESKRSEIKRSERQRSEEEEERSVKPHPSATVFQSKIGSIASKDKNYSSCV